MPSAGSIANTAASVQNSLLSHQYQLAAGFEIAVLKKRQTNGLGFTNKIRKLHGFIPTYVDFTGCQWFFNYYYDWKEVCLEFKLKFGMFLARDIGARYEVSRYFKSGLKITFWYTRTNGNDIINGETYFDKGIMISMPLDIFYTHSSRQRWYYGMSACCATSASPPIPAKTSITLLMNSVNNFIY